MEITLGIIQNLDDKSLQKTLEWCQQEYDVRIRFTYIDEGEYNNFEIQEDCSQEVQEAIMEILEEIYEYAAIESNQKERKYDYYSPDYCANFSDFPPLSILAWRYRRSELHSFSDLLKEPTNTELEAIKEIPPRLGERLGRFLFDPEGLHEIFQENDLSGEEINYLYNKVKLASKDTDFRYSDDESKIWIIERLCYYGRLDLIEDWLATFDIKFKKDDFFAFIHEAVKSPADKAKLLIDFLLTLSGEHTQEIGESGFEWCCKKTSNVELVKYLYSLGFKRKVYEKYRLRLGGKLGKLYTSVEDEGVKNFLIEKDLLVKRIKIIK